jgi:transposase
MELPIANLPDDPAVLKQTVRELAAELSKKERLIEQMQQQLAQLLRAHYGQKADRVDPRQLALFLAELRRAPAPAAPAAAPAPPATPPKKGHGRGELPAALPRRRIAYELTPAQCVCPKCGGPCVRFGEEVSEQLDYVPASLVVIEHARAKYACGQCGETVLTAPAPMQPIEKGLPGPGLLAEVIAGKYADHLPLYRQEGILGRHGLAIPRQTLCDWVRSSADLLRPLYDLMVARVLASHVIHTDDTTLPVLDEKRGKTRPARIWTYLGDRVHPYTVYAYTTSRKRDGPVEFLGDFHGYLQADAYAGYDVIYAPGTVTEVACWAHARRKYVDAQKIDAARALTAVAFIRKLYDVEDEAKALIEERAVAGGLTLDEEYGLRRDLRQEKAKPILEKFKQWLDEEAAKLLPKSPMRQAIGYTLSNWPALQRYLDDGALDPDNNAAERAMRPLAIGRKNWLFAGSNRGGETAAILFSFTQSCKTLGVNVFEYLRDVIGRVSAHPASKLAELLPDQWRPTTDDVRPPEA